jgi:hypothetical protein
MAELNRIARQCAESEEYRTRSVLAMVQDLYERLQKSFGDKDDVILPDLSDVWLPLVQEGKPVGLSAKSIGTAYFDDAPERAKFIPGFATDRLWPLQTRFRYDRLVESLRTQLGKAAVIFTREAEVVTGFIKNPLDKISLLEWIKREFPTRDVATDLGCLIAYTGRETPPTGDQFSEIWRGFKICQLAFGRFPEDSAARFFLDSSRRGERELQVDERVDKFDLLATTWVLVAPSYRDTWAAYARSLSQSDSEEFLSGHPIFAKLRDEVDTVMKFGGSATESVQVGLTGRVEKGSKSYSFHYRV